MGNMGNKRMSQRLLAVVILFFWWGANVFASSMDLPDGLDEVEGEAVSVLMQVTEATCGYESMDTDSKVLAELGAGKELMMVLKIDDEWCQVMDAGQAMYVQLKFLSGAPENERLVRELQELEKARAAEAEQDIHIRKKVFRGRVMGAILIIIIAGIFGIGIVTVLKKDVNS